MAAFADPCSFPGMDGHGEADDGNGGQCSVGQILGSRWRVRRRVGKGTFSEIYEASDLQQERGADGRHPHVAVKVAREGQKRSMLLHEEDVLRGLQPCSAVARFVEMGTDASCDYLVMQLLGENLSNMRRLTPEKRLSLQTTIVLGVQVLDAIHQMHDLGFIHRDIKPSNCCVGLSDEHECFLLDFGLVRLARTAPHTRMHTMQRMPSLLSRCALPHLNRARCSLPTAHFPYPSRRAFLPCDAMCIACTRTHTGVQHIRSHLHPAVQLAAHTRPIRMCPGAAVETGKRQCA